MTRVVSAFRRTLQAAQHSRGSPAEAGRYRISPQLTAVVVLVFAVSAIAQQAPARGAAAPGQERGGQARGAPARAAGPPPTPRTQAPIDLTGTWVSLVTEDWRWRMVMPKKGDYSSVPLSAEGRKVADVWDPAMAATDGCKPYGAAAVMRVPGRLRISWESDTVLKIETDAGLQTRRLRFGPAEKPASRSWQGQSVAEWERLQSLGGLGVSLQMAPPRLGTLKVATTSLRAGYLRKNGVPYSENAVVTEFFDRLTEFGNDYLTVHTTVDDPQYLNTPFITSTHFKREADASKWTPQPCEPS